MSAILALRQRDSVHLLTDAASYDRATGVLKNNNMSKTVVLPSLNMAVACTGPAPLGAFFGYMIAEEFTSFDDVIDRGEECLPGIFERYADLAQSADAYSTLYMIGWHERSQRPAAYTMEMWTDDSSVLQRVLENDPNGNEEKRSAFVEAKLSGTPLPASDLLAEAGFDKTIPADALVPERDLLHIMEIMRHEEIEGHYWVGGLALLTSIDRKGCSQRVIHHWEEDKIGQPIEPPAIDWAKWRAEHAVPGSTGGMSRLKRDMMARKARKLKAA